MKVEMYVVRYVVRYVARYVVRYVMKYIHVSVDYPVLMSSRVIEGIAARADWTGVMYHKSTRCRSQRHI